MKKKLRRFSFILTIFAVLASCGKDYDSDIDALWKELNGKATVEQLQNNLTNLQTSLENAKTELEKAKTDAAAALAAAKKAGDDAAAAAQEAIQKANAIKEESIAAAQAKVDALNAELIAKIAQVSAALAGKADKTELEALRQQLSDMQSEIDAIAAEIIELVSHRLTSLTVIPTTTLNNAPAILFRSLTYVPQVFDATHTAYTIPNEVDGIGTGEVTKNSGARLYIDNGETLVQYQANPKVGVRTQDIATPYFMGNVQTNITRSVDNALAGKNTPIAVSRYEMDPATGVLSVYVRKSVPAATNISFEQGTGTDKYYIASLRVPIASALYSESDKNAAAAGNAPEVAADYMRITETTVVPMIKQAGTVPHVPHTVNYDRKELLNGKNVDGKYLHYHDSSSVYQSELGQLIDHKVAWNATLDLKTLVTVCEFEKYFKNPNGTDNITVGSHADIADFKSYGLAFRFAIAKKAYNKGANNTDQQQFATIDDPVNGLLTSKVYTVGGASQTAVGREPIVRIMLMDTVRQNLVALRYMKLQFTTEGSGVGPDAPVTLSEFVFPDQFLTSKSHTQLFGTQPMNEMIYAQIGDNGMTKDQFHAIYKKIEIVELIKDGGTTNMLDPASGLNLSNRVLDDTYNGNVGVTVAQADAYAKNATDDPISDDVIVALAKDQNQAGASYNLKWYMSPKAIGTLKTGGSSTYVIKIKFVDPSGQNPYITKTFKQTIVLPTQSFVYSSIGWDAAAPGQIFNVSPYLYDNARDHQVAPPLWAYGAWTGWNTGKDHYNHIGADLMNGFVYSGTSLKPANLDQFIRYIRSASKVRIEFNDKKFANYAHLAGYTVTNNRQALWSNSQPAISTAELQTYAHPGTVNDARYDRLAATIWNQFGATAVENVNTTNLPWTYNETLGTGVNQASAQLWLSEINDSDGSTAASNLIGKKVPIQLVVEYNQYNQIPVLDFEVYILDLLTFSIGQLPAFKDGVVNGSFIDVESNTNIVDRNKHIVSRSALATPDPNPAGLIGGFSQQLWDYYQLRNIIFKTGTAKTNLRQQGNVYVPTEGVTNGPLPSDRVIKQVDSYVPGTGAYTEVTRNPTHLRFFSESTAPPVSQDYKVFMEVQLSYKWGIKTTNIAIEVKAAPEP